MIDKTLREEPKGKCKYCGLFVYTRLRVCNTCKKVFGKGNTEGRKEALEEVAKWLKKHYGWKELPDELKKLGGGEE